MSSTNWLPGIFVLVAGLLVAATYLYLARRAPSPSAPAADPALADLDRHSELLLDQLKELVADRHHLSDERFQSERARLEAAAADALRERDRHLQRSVATAKAGSENRSVEPTPAAGSPGFFGRHPELKGALWGGGAVLFFAVLGLLLSQSQHPRGANEGVTGKSPREMNGAAPVQDEGEAELRTALAQVKAHPENIEAAAEVAHELIRRQEWEEANALTQRCLNIDPFHVESRIHAAVLHAPHGNINEAIDGLQHLADTYADAHEAVLFVGALALQRGDKARALDSLERFAVEAPSEEQLPQIRQSIALLRQQLGRTP